MGTEDAAGLLLRFDGGARATATISQVSAGRRNLLSFEIDGAGARSRGPPNARRSCGSATAGGPTSCCCATPR